MALQWVGLVPFPATTPAALLSLSQPNSDDMADQSQSLRVLFDAALQGYQSQTCTTLTSHPLAQRFQDCDSVESVIAVLQEQAGAFKKCRGGDGPIMESLERVVSVLYTLTASTGFGEPIGLVRRNALMGAKHTSLMVDSVVIPSCKGHIRRLCHPSRCMNISLFSMCISL
jgi:hypothetical protein